MPVIFRPPDIVVGGLIFHQAFFFLAFFFSSATHGACWTELNHIWPQVSVIWKCMSEIRVFHPLTNRGPKNHLFGQLRNSTATLVAYTFRMKHDIDNRASALTTTRGLLHGLKTTWTLVHKWFKIGSEFSPTLRKICIPLHCQASQTEISKRNSTTLCQTVDGRSR